MMMKKQTVAGEHRENGTLFVVAPWYDRYSNRRMSPGFVARHDIFDVLIAAPIETESRVCGGIGSSMAMPGTDTLAMPGTDTLTDNLNGSGARCEFRLELDFVRGPTIILADERVGLTNRSTALASIRLELDRDVARAWRLAVAAPLENDFNGKENVDRRDAPGGDPGCRRRR